MGVRTMVLAAVTVTAGCGGEDGEAASGAEEPRGAALVAGSALDRRGLLVLPRAGGAPHLRSLASPADSVWSGRIPLPPAAEVHALESGVLVLRERDGTVRRYDPERERLVEVGSVGDSVVWSSSGAVGLFTEVGGTGLLEVDATGAWSYQAPASLVWAAPRGSDPGGTVALVRGDEGSGHTLHVLDREGGEPAGSRAVAGGTPALMTGWGRRVVLTGSPPRGLRVLGLPDLEEAERFDLEGNVVALAASASSHELYVGTRAPGAVVALNRFSGRLRHLASVGAPLEIRPAPLGGPLLVRDGDGAWWVPLEGDPRRLSTEWRADLPQVLPDGRVLGVREGRAVVLDPGSGAGGDLPGADIGPAAGHWWIFLSWHPPVPEALAGRSGVREGEEGTPASGETPEASGPDVAGGEGEEEAAPADTAAAAGEPAGVAPEPGTAGAAAGAGTEPGTPGAEVPAGFYAIVASSQSPTGIRDLAGTLSQSGFRTLVQRHRDEANEVWYRALVGPFETREDAEAAARQLRRERGLQVWISEIGPGTRAVRFEEGTDA